MHMYKNYRLVDSHDKPQELFSQFWKGNLFFFNMLCLYGQTQCQLRHTEQARKLRSLGSDLRWDFFGRSHSGPGLGDIFAWRIHCHQV